MELVKIIETETVLIEDNADATLKIRLVDITTTNSLTAYGELRISNEDLSLDDFFAVDDAIKVSIGFDGATPEVVFTGLIQGVLKGELLVLEIRGNGYKIRNTIVRQSLNRTTPKQILSAMLLNAEVDTSIGVLPLIKRHSYIMQSGTIAEELIRFNQSFGLKLIPYFDREGVLIIKTAEEHANETNVVFNVDEFKRFENGILETIVDTEIDVFDIITIMEVKYNVASNRFLLDDRKSKSFIAVTEV